MILFLLLSALTSQCMAMVPLWCQISTADEQGSGFHNAGKEAAMPLQVTGFRDPARPAVGCRSHR
jgi:hypothetical protein